MCAHVNKLSEECLLLIFERIPLIDLLQLDKVCPRWRELQPMACGQRRTFVLILGGDQNMDIHIPLNSAFKISFNVHYPSYELSVSKQKASITFPFLLPNKSFDDFLLDGDNHESQGFFDILYNTTIGGYTDEQMTELARFYNARLSGNVGAYLKALFPNVKTFVVIHSRCFEDELYSIVDLLNSWSLVNLKLWLQTIDIDQRYEQRAVHRPIGTLLRSINQKTSLHQLTLDINGEIPDYDVQARPLEFTFPIESYSFIAQLKVAKLYLGNYGREIWEIVHRYNSTSLNRICLGNHYDPPTVPALNSKYEFTNKVSQLCGRWEFETVEQFGQFCLRFSTLNMLRIRWSSDITFVQLVVNLASLTQLTHLVLEIDFQEHPKNAFALVERVEGVEVDRRISLPQVKILELDIEKRTRHDFDSLSPLVFPSVELIILDDGTHTFGNVQRAIRCHRLLVLSLKDKFASSLVRLYASHIMQVDYQFVDWTNEYVRTEDDDLSTEEEYDEEEAEDDEDDDEP